ncbi:MAG: pectinesterase family protein [Aristaeellaceae bacterium]
MYIIAKDGSGHFTSLQAALDAVPEDSTAEVILLLRMDEYHEQAVVSRNHVRLIGEARDRTVIAAQGCPLAIRGKDVTVENLTLRTEGTEAAADGPAVWHNVRMVTAQGETVAETNAPKHRPTWFLCGDSTMADYTPNWSPMTGWGTAFKALCPQVQVENCAVAGRSSKSFVAEKRLGMIELCLRPGDRLFIQFGHNDEKEDLERATVARVTYPEYLTMYIDAAREHGAEPILLTPISRRHFDAAGHLRRTHGEYPAAMRALAAAKGVRLLDMEEATWQLLSGLGEEASKQLFNWVEPGHPNDPEGKQDDTHLNQTGAAQMAEIALRLLQESEEHP